MGQVKDSGSALSVTPPRAPLPAPFSSVPRPPTTAELRRAAGCIRLKAEDYEPILEAAQLMLEIDPKLSALKLRETLGDPDLYKDRSDQIIREARRLDALGWELGTKTSKRKELYMEAEAVGRLCLSRLVGSAEVLEKDANEISAADIVGTYLDPKEMAALASVVLKSGARRAQLMGLDLKVAAPPAINVAVVNNQHDHTGGKIEALDEVIERFGLTPAQVAAAGNALAGALSVVSQQTPAVIEAQIVEAAPGADAEGEPDPA